MKEILISNFRLPAFDQGFGYSSFVTLSGVASACYNVHASCIDSGRFGFAVRVFQGPESYLYGYIITLINSDDDLLYYEEHETFRDSLSYCLFSRFFPSSEFLTLGDFRDLLYNEIKK